MASILQPNDAARMRSAIQLAIQKKVCHVMTEPKATILPVYFVADESYSMADDIEDLNSGLASLLDALHLASMAAAKVRFCVVGFSDTAVCHLEPTDLRNIDEMPRLTARGSTSFAAAFAALTARIPADIVELKADGYLVNRPAVFFLTDGAPNSGDPWQAARTRLTEFAAHPNILAFGIGQANAEVIRQVATSPRFAFITATGTDTGAAISTFITALTQSVINSGQALASGHTSLQIQKPDNFLSLEVGTV
ncbi:vWA domain-containing protein [Nocardia terpenica]|nr:VWA domain-containing protein [Nocardia terpenica]